MLWLCHYQVSRVDRVMDDSKKKKEDEQNYILCLY